MNGRLRYLGLVLALMGFVFVAGGAFALVKRVDSG